MSGGISHIVRRRNFRLRYASSPASDGPADLFTPAIDVRAQLFAGFASRPASRARSACRPRATPRGGAPRAHRRHAARRRRTQRPAPVLAPDGRARPAAVRGGRTGIAAGWPFSRSAATAAASCACTPTSICWSSLPAPIGPADERFLHAFLNPLWDLGLTVGHHVREVPEGAGPRSRQPGIPARADRRARRSSATPRCSISSWRRSNMARTATRTLDALQGADCRAPRQVQRHALSARARRQGIAGRAARSVRRPDDRQADRSRRFSAQGGAGPRALEDAEEFLLRVRSILHLEAKRHHNILGHELQERAAERAGLRRRVAAPAGRALHGRLLPPCPLDRSLAALGAARGAGADRPQSGPRRRRHPLRRRARRGRTAGNLARALPGGARPRHAPSPTMRCRACSRTPAGSRRRISSRRRRTATRCCAS